MVRQNRENDGLIMTLPRSSGLRAIEKPQKIYLGDTNQIYALCTPKQTGIGNVRETFFCRMLSEAGSVRAAARGDFVVGDGIPVEVGGRSKTGHQVRGQPSAFLALDNIETGVGNRIPLWLFGFLY